jgi:hypothetical protein
MARFALAEGEFRLDSCFGGIELFEEFFELGFLSPLRGLGI